MNALSIVVENVSLILDYFDKLKVYRAETVSGSYVEITDANTRIDIIAGRTTYHYRDDAGKSTQYYKTSYFNSVTSSESELSTAIQGGTEIEKIGYTFGNYSPPSGEWGKVYTADDLRWTMLYGIDCIGSDIAQSEFTDAQFDQLVLEALGEFEAFLTMDIRRKMYRTFGVESNAELTRSRLWRAGVDYTDEDDPYDFDPQEWSEYGFVQLRHWPLISVERAIWMSPVKGEIMNMLENDWLRLHKQFSQIRMFPKGGFTYGPYSVYGPLWTGMGSKRYPGAFEFDYSTGYESSDFVPEGLRSTIGKYATIKALAVVGDGLLAGFSSQSISLDGLSESFSSTQSATSIGEDSMTAFGRIKDVFESKDKHIGKQLFTINKLTGEPEHKTLLDVVRHLVNNKRCYNIRVESGQSIIVTEDHSLFTPTIREIQGKAIKEGMYLRMETDSSMVIDVSRIEGLKYVYDFSVQDNENFIANDFLCHNSAYFGARINQYTKEIKEWLEKNRYKYAPIPLSFVGAT